MDGYFVHFFAPDFLPTLPKHVIFVIDISGSMFGEKMKQTKDAMVTILDDLTEKDFFNIIVFSDDAEHWVPKSAQGSSPLLTYQGTKELKEDSLNFVIGLKTKGGTNIYDAMKNALQKVADVRISEVSVPTNTKPLIIFMTDGEPTVGVTDRKEIEKNISQDNKKYQVQIYGLAFGQDADFNLIKGISLSSGGFARKIFEGSDAALQLEDFYKDLASPLLKDVKFSYVGNNLTDVTNGNEMKTFFKGNEFVVAGKVSDTSNDKVGIVIDAEGEIGNFQQKLLFCLMAPTLFNDPSGCILPPIPLIQPQPVRSKSVNFIERLWAFLTIKNLLDGKVSETENQLPVPDSDVDNAVNVTTMKPVDNKVREDSEKVLGEAKALELALKYNFVTKLTSLIVTQPESEDKMVPEIQIDPAPVLEEVAVFSGHFSTTSVSRGSYTSNVRGIGLGYKRCQCYRLLYH
jgi:uncharacterized protein YegL